MLHSGAAWLCAQEHSLRLAFLPACLPFFYTTISIMSLQVNLSSPAIRDAYEKVLDGVQDYCVLTYEKASNNLRLQVAGSGGLDDVADELSDGKVQYAFVRVKDPNTQLPKFVIINWCGEGVPENRKGLLSSHSAAVANFFKAYHVSINARTEADVDAKLIMKRVTDSSGSKYSVQNEAPKKVEPIAPVGSSYKPIGAPDIRSMQASAKKEQIAPVVSFVGHTKKGPRDLCGYFTVLMAPFDVLHDPSCRVPITSPRATSYSKFARALPPRLLPLLPHAHPPLLLPLLPHCALLPQHRCQRHRARKQLRLRNRTRTTESGLSVLHTPLFLLESQASFP